METVNNHSNQPGGPGQETAQEEGGPTHSAESETRSAPNADIEEAAAQAQQKQREAERRSEAEKWANEPRRRTTTSVESMPTSGAGKAMLGAGKVLGGAVAFLVRMIRELLQGLFGKIMNKDLKGEREELQQDVDNHKRHLSELNGRERDLGRELNKESSDLQEVRERRRSEELASGLKAVADEIQKGHEHTTPTALSVSSNSSPTKSDLTALPVQEDGWMTLVKAFDEGNTTDTPYDEQYLRSLMGGDLRHIVSRASLEEVRRITSSFDSARSSENNYDIDARFPQMLTAVIYAEAVFDSIEESIDKGELKVPDRVDLLERIEGILPDVIRQMRERGDHADKWADTLMARASYNLGRLDDMKAALNRMGVAPTTLNTHEIESDANKPASMTARLPGPSAGPN